MSQCTRLAAEVRVLTDRVGGSFGMKQPTYAEYFCILQAAPMFDRPVKWINRTRADHDQ
jgi:carbon-monoxide dehydrogenase large subunit